MSFLETTEENKNFDELPREEPQMAPDTSSEEPGEAPLAVDAVIHVSIINFGIEACVEIEPPQGEGAPPTLKALESALAANGVVYNIDTEKLKELAEAPVYNTKIVVARGIAPVNGIDGTITLKFNTDKNKAPKIDEKGNVDYHDLGIVEIAKKGQVLCTITPPTEGSPGMSVKGKQMLQMKGKPVPSYVGKNTALSEDGTAIISLIDGQIDYSGKKINVHETYIVRENVDSSTGNLKVAGNLIVYGMVMPGFVIEAGNNIDVYGTVESATVIAGGNIKLASGITGSEVRCGGDLRSKFIENCTVFVKGEVKADYMLNSNINSGKSIKAEGSISKIIGGKYLSGHNISANMIGSASNVKTKLELGADPAYLERQQILQAQIPQLEKQIESIKPLYDLLTELKRTDRLSPEKAELYASISKQYVSSVSLLRASKAELESITQSVVGRGYGRIICTGTIFPGTSVSIGPASYVVNESLVNSSLYYNEGYVNIGSAR